MHNNIPPSSPSIPNTTLQRTPSNLSSAAADNATIDSALQSFGSIPGLEDTDPNGISLESISPPPTPLKGCYAPLPEHPSLLFSPSLEFMSPLLSNDSDACDLYMPLSSTPRLPLRSVRHRNRRVLTGLGLGIVARERSLEPEISGLGDVDVDSDPTNQPSTKSLTAWLDDVSISHFSAGEHETADSEEQQQHDTKRTQEIPAATTSRDRT